MTASKSAGSLTHEQRLDHWRSCHQRHARELAAGARTLAELTDEELLKGFPGSQYEHDEQLRVCAPTGDLAPASFRGGPLADQRRRVPRHGPAIVRYHALGGVLHFYAWKRGSVRTYVYAGHVQTEAAQRPIRQAPKREEALGQLLAVIAGDEPTDGGYFEIRPLAAPAQRMFIPVDERDRAIETIECLRGLESAVGVAPRVRASGTADAVERLHCLIADADTEESVAALHAFRPPPSIIGRSRTLGHAHGYWALRRSVPPEWARRANLRIAVALGSDRAVADPARVMRPPVEFIRVEPVAYELSEVAGRLHDDRAWTTPERQVARAASPSAILNGLARVVREAELGQRNVRLNWSAYRAGRHIAAGALDPDAARSGLLAAAVDAGLPEPEALATIGSGLRAGGGT